MVDDKDAGVRADGEDVQKNADGKEKKSFQGYDGSGSGPRERIKSTDENLGRLEQYIEEQRADCKKFWRNNWDYILAVLILLGMTGFLAWGFWSAPDAVAASNSSVSVEDADQANAISTSAANNAVASVYMDADASQDCTKFTPTDLLQIGMPVIFILFTFIGGRRLSSYDGQIDTLRAIMLAQQAELRKVMEAKLCQHTRDMADNFDAAFDKLYYIVLGEVSEKVEKRIEKQSVNVEERIKEQVELKSAKQIRGASQKAIAEIDEIKDSASDMISGVQEKIQKTVEQIKEDLEPFKWLESMKEDAPQWNDITSVLDVHEVVAGLIREERNREAIQVARKVTDEGVTAGDADDYHNLAVELAKMNQFGLALQILDIGAKMYPANIDLLADIIKYACDSGRLDTAEEVYQLLQKQSKDRWNWRAYVFSGDYLELVRPEEALSLYAEMRKALPYDERGYAQEAIYYRKIEQYEKAYALAKEGIENCALCAQCATTLADVARRLGENDEIIWATSRGIESLAVDQPSANGNALYFARAQARDRKLHRFISEALEPGGASGLDKDELRQQFTWCVMDYKLAQERNNHYHPRFSIEGAKRLAALQLLARQVGFNDKEWQEILDGTNFESADGSGGLGKLLEQLKNAQGEGAIGNEGADGSGGLGRLLVLQQLMEQLKDTQGNESSIDDNTLGNMSNIDDIEDE